MQPQKILNRKEHKERKAVASALRAEIGAQRQLYSFAFFVFSVAKPVCFCG